MKRIFALILSLIMLSASSALPFYTYAAESIAPAMAENPFYSGEEAYSGSIDAYSPPSSEAKKYNSKTYYSKGAELYKKLRDCFEKRNESFTLYYLSPSKYRTTNQVMNLIKELSVYASEDNISVSCTDGDYIRWAIYGYGFNSITTDNIDNGYYYYTIKLQFVYYDTAEEEKKVDEIVNSFVSGIDTNSLTDYEIIKKIHDFICSKTTYDYDAERNITGREYATTAYGVFVKGKSVCQGYAVAFYRLCKELGYNVRFVSSAQNEGCHAWNIVQLDGKYYFVDTTWDDQIIDEKASYSPNTYLLVNYPTSRENDSVYNEHKLDSLYYETEYFWENYRELLDEENYNPENKSLFSQCRISVSPKSYIYSGSYYKPQLNISATDGVQSYTCSYENNKNTGLATVNILSDQGSAPLSHRNFVITPKKMTSLSLADSGRETNSITVKWSKAQGGVSGYSVEMYKNGKWVQVKTLSSSQTSAKISSLASSTLYQFRIRSFTSFSKRNYYGAYSPVYKTATKPQKPLASSVSTKSKSITLKWKKVSCSGYVVQYATNKSMKNAKTVKASSKATSKKISKLKKGKKYYIRVRAYKKYTSASGKQCTCYSSWSSKKSVKCK